MSKRILFLSHQASRTGAPFVLLHFLRWLKDHTDLTWEVVFKEGGDLLPEFEALSPVTVWQQDEPSRLSRLKTRVQRRLGQTSPDEWQTRFSLDLTQRIVKNGADLIYSNTVTNGPMLKALTGLKCPVICHAHELEYTIDHHIGQATFELSHQRTNHYIAASHAVKENLIRNHSTPADKIDVIHEFVPTKVFSSEQKAQARCSIRRELGIPQEAPIVIGSGIMDWRKGSDLWVQMAVQIMRRSHLPVHFIWLGGYPLSRETLIHLQYDVTQAGIADRVHFPGMRSNVLDYFAASDVFTMTSREDPYPLVNLEAASLGNSIVCFDNSGGTPEFVEEDCGFIVPYLDVAAMAERVTELLISPGLRHQMGVCAAEKVAARHDVASNSAKVLAIIERCSGDAPQS